jgi:Family of unknown function (DUF6941)
MANKTLPEPTVLAFIICDTMIEDRLTNKKSLIGLFSNINATSFPFTLPVINVFVSLTGGHGEYQCSLSCVKDDGSKEILKLSGPMKFENPLDIVESNFILNGTTFPGVGIYRFEFSCNDIPIISRKFQVIERKNP